MKAYRQIIAGVLILLFTYTALSKLADPAMFVTALTPLPLLSGGAALFGYAIPLVELVVAALLFFPRSRTIGLWASLMLLTGFTAYLGGVVVFAGAELPCACGGVIRQLSWKQHLLFNTLFISLTLPGLTRRSRKPVDRVGNIPLHV